MFIDAQANRYLFSVVCVVSGVASKSLLSALSASDSPKLLVLLESPAFGFTELAAVFWIGSGGGICCGYSSDSKSNWCFTKFGERWHHRPAI